LFEKALEGSGWWEDGGCLCGEDDLFDLADSFLKEEGPGEL